MRHQEDLFRNVKRALSKNKRFGNRNILQSFLSTNIVNKTKLSEELV